MTVLYPNCVIARLVITGPHYIISLSVKTLYKEVLLIASNNVNILQIIYKQLLLLLKLISAYYRYIDQEYSSYSENTISNLISITFSKLCIHESFSDLFLN